MHDGAGATVGVIGQAVQAQQTAGYSVDGWMEFKLEPMTKLWQGCGGHSNFFFSEEDARLAMGTFGTTPFRFAETLWRLAQARPSATRGFRQEIEEFVVDVPIVAAVGACVSNRSFGSGTVYQYYIEDWDRVLFRTGRRYTFKKKSY